MKSLAALSVVTLTLLACTQSPSATTNDSWRLVSGTWESPFLPSGAITILTLTFVGDSVRGTEIEHGFYYAVVDSGTVRGTVSDGHVTFQVQHAGGGGASYVGDLVAPGTLDGIWTPSSQLSGFSLRFRGPTN